MRSAVYALAESAFFRPTIYHYILATFVLTQCLRMLFRRINFVRSVAWIPGPTALPLVGNALSLTGDQTEFYKYLLSCGEKYGRVFRLWIGTRPFVFMSKAEDIQPILSSTQHIDKSFEYSFLRDWLGNGLITATGAKWQKKRKMLTPSFHYDMLSEFAEPIVQQIDILLSILNQHTRTETPFNVLPLLKLCTLDIICVTAMGKEVGAQMKANQDYVAAVEKISTIVQRRFITPWLKPDVLFKMSNAGKSQAEALSVVDKFVGGVIEAKKLEKKRRDALNGDMGTQGGRKRKAFLDLLLESNDSGANWTKKELEDEVNTFMFAGHDTTATAVGWCLFVLGKHLDAQERIVEEFNNETLEGAAGYQTLKKLQYLELCIKEVMRLYPIAPLIARDIKTPVQLPGGRVLPVGVTVLIHSPMLHKDPSHFEHPHLFMPERFQSGHDKHPYAYIPFSAGPRNCIGQRFAQMTTKMIVAKILQRFIVTSVDSEDQLNLVSDIVLSNREGINIVLRPRL